MFSKCMSGVGSSAKSDFVRKGQRASENLLYDRAVQIPCVFVFTAQEFRSKWCCMNLRCAPKGWEVEVGKPVRKFVRSRFAHPLGWTASLMFLLVCAGILAQIPADKEEYVRLSTPALLTFDELVELEKTDEPSAELAARLDQLLHTPLLSNELDPLNLGLEKVKMDDKTAEADIQKSFEPDKSRYLGLHGTAVLSRYPIRKATIRSLPVCYDWFLGEKKEISKLESGKRMGANLAFMERIAREVRRGGRTTLIVELAVPESPTGALTVVAPHLETKCKPECRRKQMTEILGWIRAEKNPVILAGDFNTSGSDTSPTSVSKVITNRLKDPDKWVTSAIKWSTGAPTILLMQVNYMRNKNDPTGFDVPFFARKKEAKLFGDLNDFHFEDGHTFDFRGEAARSAEDRGGTLSDSNQRASKGFRYTFALAKTYGHLVGEYKLDWFIVKGYATDSSKPGGSYKFAPHFARTLQEVNEAPDDSLSDHFPITVDVALTEPPLKVAHP